jgi:guanyl-specific ribonuclease Sa
LTSLIRKISQTLGALAILGMFSTSIANADQALTVAATTPATTASSTSTVAPDASAASTSSATDVAQAGPLSDVPLNSWAYDAVNQLAKDGIIKGYPDGTFKGNRPMTRYEAAVLAYRAVDMIEAQITAGKAVEKADIDAANKLIAAYGAELKAVERHVDALQTEADTTKNEADATQRTVAGHTAQIGALTAFDKKAYIKITDIFTSFAYGANVQAACGPGSYSGNGGAVATYCNHTFGGNTLLQGVKTGGYQPFFSNDPPSSNLANGQRNSGLAFNYFKFSLTGTPSVNTSFLMELSDSSRPVDTSGRSTQTADCIPQQNFLNGNAANPATLGNCSVVNASQAAFASGETGFAPGFNNLWIQTQNPNSGLYLRVGHVQNNEGPTGGSWLGGDYYWGAQLGMTSGNFNGYVGYGVGNSAVTNATLDNIQVQDQRFTAEADYTFKVGKGAVNLGLMYANYTGTDNNLWDAAAVLCTGTTPVVAGVGTVGQTKFFANTKAVPFTTCGAGFAPVTFTNGAPITGYYLSPQANNPTLTGTAVPGVATASLTAPVGSFTTPGLAVGTPVSSLGGHAILTYGPARLYLAGTYHLGNDPYTGAGWVGPLSGDFVADYGPFRAGPGNRNKFTYEAQGFAIQFNGSMPNTNDFGGPILDNSWTTNFSGMYWVEAAVKYWLADETNVAIGYGHAGLLPNTVLPAGNATCPGCIVSGYTQNAAFLQMNMNF